MLLQTNSYIVPPEKRAEHARLMRRFRQALHQVGCDNFEVYEQVGANWGGAQTTGRFVQIMRFRDRKHQMAVQNAERTDPAAQQLIAEFCELINYPYQQQQQQFAVGFYASALPVAPVRDQPEAAEEEVPAPAEPQVEVLTASEIAEPIQDPPPALDEETAAEPQAQSETEPAAEPESIAVEQIEESAEHAGHAQDTERFEDAIGLDDGLTIETGDQAVIEDVFASDGNGAFAEEPANGLPTHEAPSIDSAPMATSSPWEHPHAEEPAQSEPELDSDQETGDDDISRLAEELAATDAELNDPHRDPRGRGRASGNGAH